MSAADFSQQYADAGAQYGVPPALLMAQADVESGGDPDAYNAGTKASGIAQIIPSTAKSLGVTDPNDPKQAIPAQAKLMAENLKRYGNIPDAISAYHGGTDQSNWGPKTQAYQQKVLGKFQQMAYNNSAQSQSDDPFDVVAGELAAKNNTNSNVPDSSPSNPSSVVVSDDPFDVVHQELQNKSIQSPNNNNTQEPKYSGFHGLMQSLGEMETQNNAKNALTDIGSVWPKSMSPTDIAMIAPEVASGVGAQSAAIGLGNALTRSSPQIAQAVAGSKLLQLGGAGLSGAANVAGYNAASGNNLTSGMGTGAAINAAFPAASMISKPISSEIAGLAKNAADKYGINIPAGLLSDNPLVNKAYSFLDRMGMTPANNNSENFAKGISNTFGSTAIKLSRGAMDEAGDNINNMFSDVKSAVPDITISNNVLTKLANIDSSAKNTIADTDTRISKQIDAIQDIAAKNNGKLPNSAWQTLTDSNSDLSTLAKESGAVGEKARDIKDALYDALGENATPDVLDKFNQAKQYYKNYKTVKNGEGTLYDPVTGDVNPSSLATKVRQTTKKYGANGLDDLQNLGDIGQQFKLSPSSGTAENQLLVKAAQHIGQGVIGSAGIGAGVASGHLPAALGGLGTAYVGGRLAGKALSSDLYKNMLLNNSLGISAPNISPALIPSAFLANKLIGQ